MMCELCIQTNGKAKIEETCDDCWERFNSWFFNRDDIDIDLVKFLG